MGLFDLAKSKLEKCQDLFMIENILALFVAILTTIDDHNLNNPNIIRDIINIIKNNIYHKPIVQFGLIILILSSQRTEIYSHVINAYDAIELIRMIGEIYTKDRYHTQILNLCKQLSKFLSSSFSETTSMQVINNRLVYSHQADSGKFNYFKIFFS